ncbi:acyltransferase family protein [Nocardia brasiliensis]|uniref:acyltransferase family protein n=1 Tax=Nocardia brasiliensis TaxID=37326 RepID=UPI0004A6E967|nr:acyltransferase [Nocardia brasiliensis]
MTIEDTRALVGLAARKPAQLPSLTGMRWWAASAVFALHAVVFLPAYPFQHSETFRRIHAVLPMQLGAAGVTFFFVLSGFILYWNRRPGDSAKSFLRRRFLKIYPTHVLALVFLLVVAPVPLARAMVWLPNLLLIHTWAPGWTALGGLNVPSWSLVAEVLFYLSFPVLAPYVDRLRDHQILPGLIAVFAMIVALHCAFYLFADGPKGVANIFVPRLLPGDVTPEHEIHSAPVWFAQDSIPVTPSYWLSYNFPPSRLLEFYIGALTAKLVMVGRFTATRYRYPLLLLAAGYALTWVVPLNFKLSVPIILPAAYVIATACCRDTAGYRGLNASRPLLWLGNLSFAFYLVQYPIMVTVTQTWMSGHRYDIRGWLAWSAVCLVLSITLAAAIFRYVDRPITQWARSIDRRQRSSAPT